MVKIKIIILFGNGNVVVFDEKGKQIVKLQQNVITGIFKKARKLNIELDKDMEIKLPYGDAKKTKGYDNYEMIQNGI